MDRNNESSNRMAVLRPIRCKTIANITTWKKRTNSAEQMRTLNRILAQDSNPKSAMVVKNQTPDQTTQSSTRRLLLSKCVPSNSVPRRHKPRTGSEATSSVNLNFCTNKRTIAATPLRGRIRNALDLVNSLAYLSFISSLLVSIVSFAPTTVLAQCPANTMTSFERIGGITVKDAILTVLYTTPNVTNPGGSNEIPKPLQSTIRYPPPSSLTMSSTSPSTLLVAPNGFLSGTSSASPASTSSASATGETRSNGLSSSLADLSQYGRQLISPAQHPIPITAECNNRCRRSAKCRAFLVDYARHTCYSVESASSSSSGSGGSSNGLAKAPTPIKLAPTNERTAYFEKVCLNLPTSDCERAWVFERVMAYHLHGHDDKIIDDVPTRLRCQEHCLNERDFRCRSGEYDYLTMQCRLSMSDRHTKASVFRPTSTNVDYFENQCVPIGNQCDAFDRYEDLDLGRAEIMRSANTSDQCQQYCTQTIKAFICRSFTWSPMTGKCYLNSANSQMVGGLDKLISAPGMIYYQRNECIDLKLECDHNAMTLQLRTNEPFRGRMYVRDDPNACETLGRSALQSTLSIPFHSPAARCATRELPSRFSSVVVVQQHPLIQRRTDRYIKLVCDFQTANKTITSSYNVVASAWTSAALINATSFAPKIRLRITDKFGVDITGARLGDELYLRIEAETDSVYDMVARSVLAKSGTTDESIVLIDRDGCPADYRIFPPLKKLNRRTIVGKFDAFKFSSDVVVRFQVDVQFCLNQCPPTNCDQSMALFNANPSALLGAQQAGSSSQQPSSGATDSSQVALNEQHSSGIRPPTGSDNGHGLSAQTMAHNLSPNDASVASSTGSDLGEQATPSQQLPAGSFYSNNLIGRFGNPNGMQAAVNQPPRTTPPLSTVTVQPSSQQVPDATGDMQTFEAGQMNASGRQLGVAGARRADQQVQQQIFSNSIADSPLASLPEQSASAQQSSSLATDQMLADDQQVQNSQQAQQQPTRERRRRRSAEPMPETPRHVPLQREIVVIESPAASVATSPSSAQVNQAKDGSSQANNGLQANGRKAMRSGRRNLAQSTQDNIGNGERASTASQRTKDNIANNDDNFTRQQLHSLAEISSGTINYKDTHNAAIASESTNDNDLLDGFRNQPRELLCTTRSSLVLAAVAFCALQLLTISICVATWLYHRRRHRDADFKIRPATSGTLHRERLY